MVGVYIRAHLSRTGLFASIPLLAFVIGASVGWRADEEFSLRYYEITAQVIPVLLLTLSFELRLFEYPTDGLFSTWKLFNPTVREMIDDYRKYIGFMYLLVVLVGLVAGEIIALLVVAFADPSGKFGQSITLGALLSGFVTIGPAALLGLRRSRA